MICPFHSVNLPEHQYKQWAEIDFLLISNKGILVFEVKGGRVSRENGVWIHTDRFGRRHEKSEGPDEQAKTAMYSLRDKLEKKLNTEPVISSKELIQIKNDLDEVQYLIAWDYVDFAYHS